MIGTEFYQSQVGRRVYRFLNEDPAVRSKAKAAIRSLSQLLPETVVFGGMIRDFSLIPKAFDFRSDIDLVAMYDQETIYAAIKSYEPKRNKFGGFRFVVGSQLFDIWAFQDTWAFKEGLAKPEKIEDLFATTFFNVDAAAQRIDSKEGLYSKDYFTWIKTRTLDINLEFNPAPEKAAARAVRMAISFDLKITPALQKYILNHAEKSLWSLTLTRAFLRAMDRHLEENDVEPFDFKPQTELLNF